MKKLDFVTLSIEMEFVLAEELTDTMKIGQAAEHRRLLNATAICVAFEEYSSSGISFTSLLLRI